MYKIELIEYHEIQRVTNSIKFTLNKSSDIKYK